MGYRFLCRALNSILAEAHQPECSEHRDVSDYEAQSERELARSGTSCHIAEAAKAKYSLFSHSPSLLERKSIIICWDFFSPFAFALLGLPRTFIFSLVHVYCLLL